MNREIKKEVKGLKIDLRNFRFAVFDVEGTLIKTKWLVFLKLIVRLNSKYSRESYLSWTGTKLLLPRPLQKFFFRFPKLSYCLDRVMLSLFNFIEKERKEPRLGVKDFLSTLRKMNFLLFASSGNNTKKTRELLKETGLIDYFNLIIGFEKIPKSEHIPHFANLLGLSIEKFARSCLFFGDSPSDMIIAERWNVYPIGVEDPLKSPFLLKAGAKEIINFKEVSLSNPIYF